MTLPATDAIGMLSDSLEKRGIRFYMTGHTRQDQCPDCVIWDWGI